jgi:hypothetical protein
MYDIPSAYAGMLVWDLSRIEPVLREWAAWAPTAPEEVTTAFRAMRIPPLPELPEGMRGRQLVVIDGAVVGSDERGAELLAGLRALRPEIDTFGRMPAKALTRIHMDPEGGAPFASDSAMLGDLPDAGVDAFIAAAGPDADTSVLVAELRQLGGALGRRHEGAGVLDRLQGQFIAFAGGMAMTPQMGAQAHADAVAVTGALAAWDNGRKYLNFAETPVDVRSAYRDSAWVLLAGIRSAVDPHGVLVGNHPVARLHEA